MPCSYGSTQWNNQKKTVSYWYENISLDDLVITMNTLITRIKDFKEWIYSYG